MPPREFNDLGDFCLRHFKGEDAADAHAMAMDMQHYLDRVLTAFGKELFQDMNNEFHRRVIVIQQQHLVERRLFNLGARFRDDTGSGTVPALCIVVAAILHSGNVAPNLAQIKSKP